MRRNIPSAVARTSADPGCATHDQLGLGDQLRIQMLQENLQAKSSLCNQASGAPAQGRGNTCCRSPQLSQAARAGRRGEGRGERERGAEGRETQNSNFKNSPTSVRNFKRRKLGQISTRATGWNYTSTCFLKLKIQVQALYTVRTYTVHSVLCT